MLRSGARHLTQPLHESDVENRRLRGSVRTWTVVDFARNLNSSTGKRHQCAVQRRKPIRLTRRFFRGIRCARPRRNAHHPRRIREDECRAAGCIQVLRRNRSSSIRRGPFHAAGQRDPIRQIGGIGLRRSRCRVSCEAAGALRGQTEGCHRTDDQDDATVTGPLRHCRVLPCRGGRILPKHRLIAMTRV
jgi:hypothetical protein